MLAQLTKKNLIKNPSYNHMLLNLKTSCIHIKISKKSISHPITKNILLTKLLNNPIIDQMIIISTLVINMRRNRCTNKSTEDMISQHIKKKNVQLEDFLHHSSIIFNYKIF